MEIDEEPPSVANTCSRESRRQCVISFSLLSLVLSITYTASIIIYTSYKMVVDMDRELENSVIKVIGLYDTCASPPKHFNIATEAPGSFRILWNDPPLTYETMVSHLYVFGTPLWTVLPNMTISLSSPGCHNLLVYLTP